MKTLFHSLGLHIGISNCIIYLPSQSRFICLKEALDYLIKVKKTRRVGEVYKPRWIGCSDQLLKQTTGLLNESSKGITEDDTRVSLEYEILVECFERIPKASQLLSSSSLARRGGVLSSLPSYIDDSIRVVAIY